MRSFIVLVALAGMTQAVSADRGAGTRPSANLFEAHGGSTFMDTTGVIDGFES